MFTKEEFFLMWLPLMLVASFAASMLVLGGSISKESAALFVVVAGIGLKVIARLINPPAPGKPEVEVKSDEPKQ